MALDFSNTQGGARMSSGPRVVTVYDNVSGCPATTRTNPLLTATIAVAAPTYFFINASIIRNIDGRNDLQIFIQGPAGSNFASNTLLTRRLNWTYGATWDHVVADVGAYGNAAGTYTITLTADSPGAWGCTRPWGHLSALAFEVA